MKGSTITLKNVPPELHRILKEQARRHKRSMNQEVIVCLESAVKAPDAGRPSLSVFPPAVAAGKALRPLGNRSEWQDEMRDGR